MYFYFSVDNTLSMYTLISVSVHNTFSMEGAMTNNINPTNDAWTTMVEARTNYVQHSLIQVYTGLIIRLGKRCVQHFVSWQTQQDLTRAYNNAEGVGHGNVRTPIHQ